MNNVASVGTPEHHRSRVALVATLGMWVSCCNRSYLSMADVIRESNVSFQSNLDRDGPESGAFVN
jgi:hypothetical protein